MILKVFELESIKSNRTLTKMIFDQVIFDDKDAA